MGPLLASKGKRLKEEHRFFASLSAHTAVSGGQDFEIEVSVRKLRGRCTWCDRKQGLRKDLTVYAHGKPCRCAGSGHPPSKVKLSCTLCGSWLSLLVDQGHAFLPKHKYRRMSGGIKVCPASFRKLVVGKR